MSGLALARVMPVPGARRRSVTQCQVAVAPDACAGAGSVAMSQSTPTPTPSVDELVGDGVAAYGAQPAQEADQSRFPAVRLSGSRLKLAARSTRVAPGLSSDLSTVTGLLPDEPDHAQAAGARRCSTMSLQVRRTGVGCAASAARSLRPGAAARAMDLAGRDRQWREQRLPRRPCRTGARRLAIGMGFRIRAEALRTARFERGEHRPVARVGLLAHEPADRLVGRRASAGARPRCRRRCGCQFGTRTWPSSTLGFAGQIRGFWRWPAPRRRSRCRPSSVTITWNASSKRRPLSDSRNARRYSSWYAGQDARPRSWRRPACAGASASPLSRSSKARARAGRWARRAACCGSRRSRPPTWASDVSVAKAARPVPCVVDLLLAVPRCPASAGGCARRGSAVSCMRACSISMMMLLACAPDSAFVSRPRAGSSASMARCARAVRRYRKRCEAASMRVGEPGVVAFPFAGRGRARIRMRGLARRSGPSRGA